MGTHQQHRDQVQLTLTVRTSPPHTISISDPNPAKPLQLICTIAQTASPFPDRAVTMLTKYSCLDTSPLEDAFFLRAMSSPKLVSEPGSEQSAQNAAPELPMRPVGKHITTTRISGNPDLARRGGQVGFTFLTIPPIGQGQAEVRFDLPPSKNAQTPRRQEQFPRGKDCTVSLTRNFIQGLTQ
ncbi:hypothetical protein SAMD00023353_1302530 [Rosellinia necatrix]|uniref:Uncharacterized protein n=1 Tax=Rosellinia necatrix TaxID=77044 RepID=A0A1S8A6X7_ROSNE|nr:hypothetical protein SAMD00023353_1302530 [Rosellinia necatrix]